MPYIDFCADTYMRIFAQEYQVELAGRTTSVAREDSERSAQRTAIKETFKAALAIYSPQIEPASIWKAIYLVHLKRKSGIEDMNALDEVIIQKVISADNSWKKTSGHAFESFIFEIVNPQLENQNIRFVLQSDLTQMIRDDHIQNDRTDIDWLSQRIHTDVFDLYAIASRLGRNYVFGCIQSKTSIRDRVTRDREPSQQAMDARFWSAAVVLNGAFLALPKFIEMVNGGGNDFPENGWHGMYVMSNQYAQDRIYSVNKDLNTLVAHAQFAFEYWMGARYRFDSSWRP